MKANNFLMLEDNKELRESLQESLSFSYKIIAVANRIECLKVLKKEMPDLILLDLLLSFPLDKFSILRILKNDPQLVDIPVIIMSAINSEDKINLRLELGENDYLVKSLKINQLLLKLKNLKNIQKVIKLHFEKSLVIDDEQIHSSFEMIFKKNLSTAINELIDDNTLNVHQLAEKLSMSISTLERRVIKYYSNTPQKYIVQSRLLKAEMMLRQDLGSIKDIAYTTGFNTSPYFCTCFKKEYGISPLVFKKSISD